MRKVSIRYRVTDAAFVGADADDTIDRLVELLPSLQTHFGGALGVEPVQHRRHVLVLISTQDQSDDIHVVSPPHAEVSRPIRSRRRADACPTEGRT